MQVVTHWGDKSGVSIIASKLVGKYAAIVCLIWFLSIRCTASLLLSARYKMALLIAQNHVLLECEWLHCTWLGVLCCTSLTFYSSGESRAPVLTSIQRLLWHWNSKHHFIAQFCVSAADAVLRLMLRVCGHSVLQLEELFNWKYRTGMLLYMYTGQSIMCTENERLQLEFKQSVWIP